MTCADVTQAVILAKQAKGLKWEDISQKVGRPKEWTTAALLGQMPMSPEEAEAAGAILDFTAEEIGWLQAGAYRGSLGQTVPTDPLIYRFYEIIQVYGTTLKALIEEEFGDGIMSAIDFTMDIRREPDPKGDRVVVTLNGKFLPYNQRQVSALQEVLNEGHEQGSPSSISLHAQLLTMAHHGYKRQLKHDGESYQ